MHAFMPPASSVRHSCVAGRCGGHALHAREGHRAQWNAQRRVDAHGACARVSSCLHWPLVCGMPLHRAACTPANCLARATWLQETERGQIELKLTWMVSMEFIHVAWNELRARAPCAGAACLRRKALLPCSTSRRPAMSPSEGGQERGCRPPLRDTSSIRHMCGPKMPADGCPLPVGRIVRKQNRH